MAKAKEEMVESLDERPLAWMSGRKPVVRGGKLLTRQEVGSGTHFSLVAFLGDLFRVHCNVIR